MPTALFQHPLQVGSGNNSKIEMRLVIWIISGYLEIQMCSVEENLNCSSLYKTRFVTSSLFALKHHQFSSVSQSCPTLCDSMNCSMPGLPVHHQLPEFTQTHVHRVGDATQPSHHQSSPSPPAHNPSQHQGLFQWVNSSHEVAKVLEFQLQHQSFQRTPRADLL